ncbi:hypothetical protein BCR32DRAFT_301240 [Anaeromyces robustus]|uniref:Uncharacterized protein n=1 Tax=Anaeromyces robustus TaxID=1754192 RepID=A0A1Y1XLF9_9FUNG|nr:hypothetical protein BCR32DRAFT_301240 [Anaeromyces robustus]|eukprot:ORX86588.1 hypothetical protein BCR32DRAFT_301240 [Anaeromyces robustus]
MKLLTFTLVIITLTLLSSVFSETINYNKDENKLNPISSTITTLENKIKNEINSPWKNVYSFLDKLNIPVDYMLKDIEMLSNNSSLTVKDSLVINSLMTSLFNKVDDNVVTENNINEKEKEEENESKLKRRNGNCKCSCKMAGNCECNCDNKFVIIREIENECLKKVVGVDIQKINIKMNRNGSFSVMDYIKSLINNRKYKLKVPIIIAQYELCLYQKLQ